MSWEVFYTTFSSLVVLGHTVLLTHSDSLSIYSGIDPSVAFSQLRKFQPKGPLVNSEFYPGWLDHWGEAHQKREAASIAFYLDKILAMNASVNLYMFQGGTSFGFMNGEC